MKKWSNSLSLSCDQWALRICSSILAEIQVKQDIKKSMQVCKWRTWFYKWVMAYMSSIKAGWTARNHIGTQLLCEMCAILGWLTVRQTLRVYIRNKQPISNTRRPKALECLNVWKGSYFHFEGYLSILLCSLQHFPWPSNTAGDGWAGRTTGQSCKVLLRWHSRISGWFKEKLLLPGDEHTSSGQYSDTLHIRDYSISNCVRFK